MFIGKYNKSVIVTYTGVVFALLAIFNALNNNIKFGMVFLIFAGVCDLFDGKFANSFKRTEEEKAFGVQIDSLADMISFVAAPIVLAYCLGLNAWYHLIIYSFYALAAITRLGYFNIQAGTNGNSPIRYYSGLPVTFAALIFPVAWLSSWWWLQPSVFKAFYTLVLFIVAVLFISNIKIKKPQGIAYLFFICLAIVLTGLIILKGV
ncbi:MAG: CDP-alcohol phosphatidyltransferase family protein [Clostridia bacterium]|nr:CDP-alcohol phosphatidyltransferase family protein [Clostridia bacterium]